jgi:23S rRNA (uracil1939-C5)-methyltransferase
MYPKTTNFFGGKDKMQNNNINLSKTQTIQLKIEKLIFGGDGLGRWNNIAVFVPETVPGEVVKAKVTERKKSYAKAELVEILEKSSYRVEPKCPFFVKGCGGCQWMHIDYSEQLKIKREIVSETLKRVGKLDDVDVLPVLGMNSPYHYRNKATANVSRENNRNKIGFFAGNSHQVIDIYGKTNGKCLAQNQLNNRILSEIGTHLKSRLPKTIALRSGTEAVSINLPKSLIRQLPSQDKIAKNVYIQINGKTFGVYGTSFFQTNTNQAEVLVNRVKHFLADTNGGVLLDIYSGVGLFGISVAHKFHKVIGIESSKSSIIDANENSKLNDIQNTTWLHGKAREKFSQIDENIDVIILDPPREGCDKSLVKQIVKSSTKKIIYVSCDVATLSRDLRIIDESGFSVKQIQPIDMFPHTYHIECVADIERR